MTIENKRKNSFKWTHVICLIIFFSLNLTLFYLIYLILLKDIWFDKNFQNIFIFIQQYSVFSFSDILSYVSCVPEYVSLVIPSRT